jgi:hypothetical protein
VDLEVEVVRSAKSILNDHHATDANLNHDVQDEPIGSMVVEYGMHVDGLVDHFFQVHYRKMIILVEGDQDDDHQMNLEMMDSFTSIKARFFLFALKIWRTTQKERMDAYQPTTYS